MEESFFWRRASTRAAGGAESSLERDGGSRGRCRSVKKALEAKRLQREAKAREEATSARLCYGSAPGRREASHATGKRRATGS